MPIKVSLIIPAAQAEKRKAEEDGSGTLLAKRQQVRVEGDVSNEVISQILATITDPSQMLGPDVSCFIKNYAHSFGKKKSITVSYV